MGRNKKKKVYLWIAIIVLLFIVIGGLSGLIVEYLWFGGLGYQNVFWTIRLNEMILFLITFAVVLGYVGVNFRIISKEIRPLYLHLGERPGGAPNVVSIKAKEFKVILYVVAVLMGLFFAFSLSSQWDELLRFVHGTSFGNPDPLFGIDTGFYVFRLPFIETIQNGLAILTFLVTLIIIFYHLATRHVVFSQPGFGKGMQITPRARKQIFANLGIWLLLLACGYFLDRFHLVFKSNDLIYGADYTDVHVLLPLYWVMAIGCALLALYAFFQSLRYASRKFFVGALVLLVVGIVGQAFLPGIVQNFQVDPNEFSLEKPYIKNNIQYTRKAYGLDSVTIRDYNASDSITLQQIKEHKKAIQNIRIWDQKLTVETYKQLQEIRLYYQFYNIDLDRYHTNKGYRQVLISARELDANLPPKAQTWVNSHLQYTHGYGVVMSPTTQKTEEGSPIFYIKDIPPHSDMGLKVDQPAIYYGESKTGYKIVNTEISELDYPKGDNNKYTHYQGTGGIAINNWFRRLLFAWHFADVNILLTDYIHKGSKLQFWSSLRNRVHKIAPFLQLDEDPYIVLSKGKLYWIQDAYTTASQYPYSEPYSGQKNYIRNAVKIVIDAYNGSVDFYVANPNDPVIKMYENAFPGVFQPLEKMPGKLKKHVKYPKDLFHIQLQKFSTYHMLDPRVFYNQEDLWESPQETYGSHELQMEPYYLLGTLPGSKKLQYMLISPMTPKNRDNMISWMVVKSDFPEYGKIIDYELPKEHLFLGPAQIEAKINQNTEISRQLSLWDQRGSKVIRGNLMVIPIENSFLYVEPVFLFSTSVNIPQLKRVIATTGSNVVMEPTLDDALTALYGKTRASLSSTDSTTVKPKEILKYIQSPRMDKLKGLWKEMQDALQDKKWRAFGEKMDEINQLLKK